MSDRKEDRELLEKAAKAAGIYLEWDGHPDDWCPMYYEGKTYHAWNPLTDDGDALRLAVKLNMAVSIHQNHCMACAQTGTMQTVKDLPTPESTRRAIVLAAAAAIGGGE